MEYANVAPITVNTPSPIASNCKNTLRCLLILEYNTKTMIPEAIVIPTYAGSEIELGRESSKLRRSG